MYAQNYNPTKIKAVEKIGYGLGDMASNIVFQSVMILMAYFYTDVFGIGAAAVGTLFLVVRIIDAVTDPLMGTLADRTKTRWGKISSLSFIIMHTFCINLSFSFYHPKFF